MGILQRTGNRPFTRDIQDMEGLWDIFSANYASLTHRYLSHAMYTWEVYMYTYIPIELIYIPIYRYIWYTYRYTMQLEESKIF